MPRVHRCTGTVNMPRNTGHRKTCASGHVSPAGFIVFVITQDSSVWNLFDEFKRSLKVKKLPFGNCNLD